MPSLESCECSFNPLDPSIVCLVGDGVSRMMRLQDGQLRVIQNYLYKRQGQHFTSHAWLSDDSLVVASYNGERSPSSARAPIQAQLSLLRPSRFFQEPAAHEGKTTSWCLRCRLGVSAAATLRCVEAPGVRLRRNNRSFSRSAGVGLPLSVC